MERLHEMATETSSDSHDSQQKKDKRRINQSLLTSVHFLPHCAQCGLSMELDSSFLLAGGGPPIISPHPSSSSSSSSSSVDEAGQGVEAKAEPGIFALEHQALVKSSSVTQGLRHFDQSGLLATTTSAMSSTKPSLSDSFVMLPSSSLSEPPTFMASAPSTFNLSARLEASQALFNMMSATSTVSHPLCTECAEELCQRLERDIKSLRMDVHEYEHFLAQLRTSNTAKVSDIEEELIRAEEEALLAQEAEAAQLLDSLIQERDSLENTLHLAQADLTRVKEEEERYWRDLNALREEEHLYSETFAGLTAQYNVMNEQLDRLKRANVYNDAFRIWHDGSFGTINGLRMGRLPQEPVEWSEINAAIGQATLLLDILAVKLNFTFKSYKLIPMGSVSKIERLDGDKGGLELYGTGDLAGILFWNRRFDNGMIALLDCLGQISEFVEAFNPRFKIPYTIQKERIGQVCIRLQFNTDQEWTKALKYFLIDLKWVLAFCSSTSESRSDP